MLIKNVKVPIYGNKLHIIMTGDFTNDYPEINKKFHNNYTEQDAVLGLCQQRGNHLLVIINVGKHQSFKKETEIEIIATMCHEAIHLCNYIFIDKGVELDVNNDEPQAYLTDWIMKEIYKCYLKFKIV